LTSSWVILDLKITAMNFSNFKLTVGSFETLELKVFA
jgi:hypothetical protein